MNSEELRLPLLSQAVNPSPADIALEQHMFKLRKIQHRIIRLTQQLEYRANIESHPVPNLWRSYPRYDLENWISEVEILAARSRNQSPFKSVEWLLKLANYAIISLFPNPYLAVRGGDSRYLGAAAVAVLSTFRKLRVKDKTTCFTWTAVSGAEQSPGISVSDRCP